MNITNTLRGAMRRIAGVSLLNRASGEGLLAGSAAKAEGKRRTVPLPSIL